MHSSSPPPHPYAAPYAPVPSLPPARRGYGIVVLVGAVMWGLGLLIGGTLLYASSFALLASIESAADGGSGGVDPWAPLTASIVVFALTALGVVATIVLDLVAVVQSVRRLVGRIGDAIVPWCVIVAITIAWLAPVLSIALVVLAVQGDDQDLMLGSFILLMAVLYLVVPGCRLVQLIVGIIRTCIGERPRTT
ncbi:hypothetical protein BF93_17115 [Brachybacterium phenoliresistens]|uniref:Uncharacterized protein n=1 Tax=Brachybacterium phenoliresistens TaxID=396014 RepID=Z9JSL8_9MICO|nr:hypothetical protein [Brachybacterium phenoliresistens]EWS81370.1 hypothetical protein BF93_17115 [Brachybacterium phenoliresistens]